MRFKTWLRGIAGAAVAAILLSHAHTAAADADWDQTVAAAKKEGQLVLSVPSGSVWAAELQRFEAAYPGIKLKMTAFSGRDFWPRFTKEREVGQYLWDLRVGGTDHFAYKLKSSGQFEPIRDLLVLPEVVDADNWYGGIDGLFLDNEKKYVLAYVMAESSPARVNKAATGGVVPSVDDLIDPRWTGKISMADPNIGSSLAALAVIYKRDGADWVRKLFANQKPTITRVPRQQLDWMTTGRYPIAWGMPTAQITEYAQRGGDASQLPNVRGAYQWSNGVGALQMPTKAPHPNATKVFVNWLLTKDVQAHLMKGVQLNSRRKDVPLGAPDAAVDFTKLSQYTNGQAEEYEPYQDKVTELLREFAR